MPNFYTNVRVGFGKILFRGVVGGERVTEKLSYSPRLYVPHNESGGWSNIHGQPLKEITFKSIKEASNFVKEYAEVANYPIYGNRAHNYSFIEDKFPGQVYYDISKILVGNIDIETSMDHGLTVEQMMENPIEEITAITYRRGPSYYVFGCGDYTPTKENIQFIHCECELDMLEKFLRFWCSDYPDILTGWNIDFFDIPYMVRRITHLFDLDTAKLLSPWGMFSERRVKILDREQTKFDLVGIASLDYLQLYKKFAPNPNQESYKLGFIGYVELGKDKIDYSNYGNLTNLLRDNYQLFIEYNVRDVELVHELDEKLKLISMVLGTAYDAKVNPEDVLSQVRLWNNIIYRDLRSRKMATPPQKSSDKDSQFEGAYVKPPQVGMHKWCVSYDAASLYPSLIMQTNISPEMLNGESIDTSVDALLAQQVDTEALIQGRHMTLAANGYLFDTEQEGFLPSIIRRMLSDRKQFKSAQIEAEHKLEAVKAELKSRGV